MTFTRKFLALAALSAVLSFSIAAAFSAYLRPDMLVQFANMVLCY